jgi:hypothetical protein
MKNKFWKGFLTYHFAISLTVGLAFKALMPALNPLGIAYIGLTWPISTLCIALHGECSAVPPQKYADWFFD